MPYLETLELVKPSPEYGPQYLAMVDEHIETGEEYGYNNIALARENFAAFVQELERRGPRHWLPQGFQPSRPTS
ncbi:hypothetical protein KDW_19100 [Dictyobacter vulcani]|uniref:Uncharacterized protein n=1 Tax=Dictyobacter vulcani TaxID=2607529 RepID=A0A5J4KEN6_9CHLR|nr:hypothetical protein [Dictyobacter vulcani]GER87748.1 hypothetical protein KDW_19100 [Dictyobacter vulcani]